MSESEKLVEASVKEVPYSQTPLTKCPKGGLHRGPILDPCEKCGNLLVYADFEKPIRNILVHTGGKVVVVSGVKTHSIKCIDCGAVRDGIKPQDIWQVKRCKPCQAAKSKKSFKKFMKKVGKSNGKV